MPNTLEENVNRVKAAKTAIANAITAKGGTVSSGDGLEDFASDIATIPSGGGSSAEKKDVNFYDYDGVIVNSYTAAEFAELTAMPSNPSHDGLTSQGWNWSLSDAKTYVAANGRLNIGQMYASNTTDGKTYLHIRLSEGRLKPYLGLTGNSSGTAVSIDWGDGSTAESVTLNASTIYTPHEYASDGGYVISIAVTNGTISLDSTSNSTNLFRKSNSADLNYDKVYANILTKAEIGTGVTSIGYYAFAYCSSLTSITIPSTVTSIGSQTFYYCYSLTSIAIPSTVTSIGDSAFNSCYSLTSITIPSTITSIGDNTFAYCSSLTSIAIPSSVTSIGSQTFYNCYSLTSIAIPSTVTSIGNSALQSCSSLTSITIPSTVTSIGSNTYNNCFSLTSITIPSSVTSIGTKAFYYEYGLAYIKFSSTTPPTVSASNAWFNIPTDCIIYVPTGSLSDYTSANYYPSSSTYTYVEY